jgi:hypothetical protein
MSEMPRVILIGLDGTAPATTNVVPLRRVA